jgi:hypothetical protein
MVRTNNIFYINIVNKSIVIKLKNKSMFFITILKKRKRIKLKFKKKKLKTSIFIQSPYYINYYLNYNKSTHFLCSNYKHKPIILKNIIRSKIKWNFKKFKYHGKGYKVKKFNKLNKITFRFGKSHWTKVIFRKKFIIVKRTKKNSYCCISIKNNSFKSFLILIKKIKGVNKYTKRGVRLTRQSVKRRFGKISQASSVYK